MKKIGFGLAIVAAVADIVSLFFGGNLVQQYGPGVLTIPVVVIALSFFAYIGHDIWSRIFAAKKERERERERALLELEALTKSARDLLARFAPSGELLEVANFFKGDVERLKIGAVVVQFAPTDARQLLDAGLLSLVQSSRDNFGDVSAYKITPKGVEFYDVGVKAGLFDGLED